MSEAGRAFRTYEVHQRQRVGESTAKIRPAQLVSDDYLHDPYPLLAVLRENYPCYRDWLSNAYWITRYDDVTSIFVDEANFETRSKRWSYGLDGHGRDLRDDLAVWTAETDRIDAHAPAIAERVVHELVADGAADLAVGFAARYPLELLGCVLDLPDGDLDRFASWYWTMQRGHHWKPQAVEAGRDAIEEMVRYVEPLLEARRTDPGDDMISAIATADLAEGPATAADVVITVLEGDHETLHGGLANMWFLLLTHPDQLEMVRDERRMVTYAYLEMLRHSTPVLTARRFARHEVERFGRLLPEGALMLCSAAATNRDPRVFDAPDRFVVGRKDLCQREARGMYRADGLPTGIAFGTGRPSRHPALPEDRPRSRYARTRDVAVLASNVLLDATTGIRLVDGAEPTLRSLSLGEMHTCWELPVEMGIAP